MKSTKQAQRDKNLKIAFIKKEAEKKVDVIIDGKLFTSYCWYDNVYRPMLYPVCTSAGTMITRGFPIKPREGEQVDLPHQVGLWLNYGNVNGCDFWDNGESGSRDPKGGEVIHHKIKKLTGGSGEGILVKGKEELNFFIPAGGSVTFKYRVVINSGSQLNKAEIDSFADDFAKKYE
jgi:hypothetical protein